MSGEAVAFNAHILLPELFKSVLKALVDGASMTCWGSRFQSVTTVWLKNARRMRLVFLDRDSFRLCPLRLCPVSVNWKKNWLGSMFSFFETNLCVSIRSPVSRLFSSVVNSKIFLVSLHDFFLKIPISFVALLCTRSRHSIYFFSDCSDLLSTH